MLQNYVDRPLMAKRDQLDNVVRAFIHKPQQKPFHLANSPIKTSSPSNRNISASKDAQQFQNDEA